MSGCGRGAVAALALQDFDGRCCPGIAVLRALAAPLLPRCSGPPPRRCGALSDIAAPAPRCCER